MNPPRVLVVNADDFGLTPGVCEGILRAHADGIVTSTSVLVGAPAFAGCVRSLVDSGLPAGLHLCVVGEDPPLLSASEIPSLVDATGRLPATWRQFCARAAAGRIDPDDLTRELGAQADAALAAGIRPSHVDAHQNLHLWPSVGRVALAVAHRLHVDVVRYPRTARWTPTALAVRSLGAGLARRARRGGRVVPDTAAGLDTAGHMDEETLVRTIESLGRSSGHADLTVHPGVAGDPDRDRYRWGYSWPDELEALCSAAAADAVHRAGFVLGSFDDLARAGARVG